MFRKGPNTNHYVSVGGVTMRGGKQVVIDEIKRIAVCWP